MATPDEPSQALLGAPDDTATAPADTSSLLARASTIHAPDAIPLAAWEERLWKEVPQTLWDKIVMRDGVPGLHDSKDVCRVLEDALYDPRIHKVCVG